MTVSLCAGQNCASQWRGMPARRIAVSGLRLCVACSRGLRADLVALPGIYADCESALQPRRNPGLQRVSGSRRANGIRLDEEALTSRSAIIGLLASWCALVADERAVTKPARRQPADLAVFLIKHMKWLLAHSAAADFADEVSQVTTQARHSAYTRPAVSLDLGQCIRPDCTAAMSTAPRTRVGGTTRAVGCSAGHTWQPDQWLGLFRQMQDAKHHHDRA